METTRLTTAQAIIRFLAAQQTARDNARYSLFGGILGIFGHGNVAGLGQAIMQEQSLPFFMPRNEQAMVHTAIGYAKANRRMRTMVCTSSIGPGATNMVTGAATATINRIPVLLLPGDIFARRNVDPVLQQIELSSTQSISVNDCFIPVSKYFDRITRPEQILISLPEAIRVLTSPAETGAVTIAMPQDVQAEAYDFPVEFFQEQTTLISRERADKDQIVKAAEIIRHAQSPMIIAGGGVIYSAAEHVLLNFGDKHNIPVAETMAGKGSVPFDWPLSLGGVGVTGTTAAKEIATQADLVVGIGTRYTDFTTGSKTAFTNPNVRFININISAFDAGKHAGLSLIGDARETLEELSDQLGTYTASTEHRKRATTLNAEWNRTVESIYSAGHEPLASQGAVIGAVNEAAGIGGIVVCAAGSMPGDLHKLWQTRSCGQFHLEYGFSCMGYEIAGGLGAKLACPEQEVFVLVGDASYLMMAQEITTAVQEGIKLIIVVVNNHGFASIGGLSESVGTEGFGTKYRYNVTSPHGKRGDKLPVDFVKNAASLGATALKVDGIPQLQNALEGAKKHDTTTIIVIDTDREARVASYGAWWDVPVAEVSTTRNGATAFKHYTDNKKQQRYFLNSPE